MKNSYSRQLWLACWRVSVVLVGWLLLTVAPGSALAQPAWQWASTSLGLPGNSGARIEKTTTDNVGDVYVTGAFTGAVKFGSTTLLSSTGTDEVFVAKLDGFSGAWLWATAGLGPGADIGYDVAVDNAGSVYITGQFGSQIAFPSLTPLFSTGGLDAFVAKFDAATGAPLVRLGGGGIGNDVGRSLVVIPGGTSLYVTGDYQSGTATFGSPLVNVGAGTSDIFVAQLPTTVAAWTGAVTVGGPNDDVAQGIALDASNNVYITGYYHSPTLTFSPVAPIVNAGGGTGTSGPNSDIFVARQAPGLGVWQWAQTAGGIGNDRGTDIAITPSNHVITTGGFMPAPANFGGISFPASASAIDAYVARSATATGTWQWVRAGGGATNDSGFGISVSATNTIYFTGSFQSATATFGASTFTNFNGSGLSSDVFVSKLTIGGAWSWTKQAGAIRDDVGHGVAVSATGAVFVAGDYFSPAAAFSPFFISPGVFRDAFVGRIPGALPNLVISSPTSIPCGGTYNNIVVQPGGIAMPCGPLYVAGTVTVQNGGTWTSNCSFPLTGPGNFTLQAGGLMNICSLQGIELTGAVGDIQVTGIRTYNTNADYNYVHPTGPQATGLGLAGARDLTITVPNGANLTQSISVRRWLYFPPAIANNLVLGTTSLTLLSTLTQTAMITNSTPGIGVVGTGGVHQRIVDGTFAAGTTYRHLSSPVTGSTVGNLACPGFTPVINPAFNPTGPYAGPVPTVYGYDESQFPGLGTFGFGYYSPLTLSMPLIPTTGIVAAMTGNRKPLFRGSFNNGSYSLPPKSFTAPAPKAGWHLIGNPYPSPVDLGAVAAPVGMLTTAWVWQAAGPYPGGTYVPHVLGSGTPQWLPVAQGFWVQVTLPIAITPNFFTNAMRPSTYLQVPYYSRPLAAAGSSPAVRLTLRAASAPAEWVAEARLSFVATAAAGATDAGDAAPPAHNVTIPTLLTLTPDDQALALDVRPTADLVSGTTVPLLLDVPAAGAYELHLAEQANLPETSLLLLDRLTGTRYDLTTQPTVTFTALRAGEDRTRFALVVGSGRVTGIGTAAAPRLLTITPNPAHGSVRVTLGSGVPAALELLDATGRVVRYRATPGAGATLDLVGLPTGVYFVRVGSITQRLLID